MDLNFINNQYVVIALAMFVAFYAEKARVELPPTIKKLFSSDIFRVLFLSSMLVYKFNKAPQVSVVVSIVFLLTMHYLNQDRIIESFQ